MFALRKVKWYKPAICAAVALTIALSGNLGFASMTAHAETVSVASTRADRIISTGLKYKGTPYRFGAPAGRTDVFDCSSFVQYLYKKQGVSLPRVSRDQAKKGSYVSKSNLRKGDLLFFWTSKSGRGKVGHVAIYMGNGKMLHTYKKGIGVTVSSVNSSYWKSHYITARRVL
ncbi:C40 family peptidase [Paenibacillus flagellatus]|uniref:NlpC/P60 family protein n=1 Tax=Paenibacillus flagellatus TaxID=2211139 RepID=A0A2V5K9V1_9BACL|nr:C40 family peptidase [Paenibacillus flagellatus]PYI54824.1 NlpC/P60 family protein [Paenibacillus flagellatus]